MDYTGCDQFQKLRDYNMAKIINLPFQNLNIPGIYFCTNVTLLITFESDDENYNQNIHFLCSGLT